jgi:hypothetical protein
MIERRGTPVAVVMGIDDYRRIAELEQRRGRWKSFLATSASVRAAGGFDLEIPARRPRPSPFGRRRR